MQNLAKSWHFWTLLNLFLWGVLGFYSTIGAAPPGGQPPFADAAEQRSDMIRELQEIKELLKEQNTLLRENRAKGDALKPDVKPTPRR